jgi:hypothetical protein
MRRCGGCSFRTEATGGSKVQEEEEGRGVAEGACVGLSADRAGAIFPSAPSPSRPGERARAAASQPAQSARGDGGPRGQWAVGSGQRTQWAVGSSSVRRPRCFFFFLCSSAAAVGCPPKAPTTLDHRPTQSSDPRRRPEAVVCSIPRPKRAQSSKDSPASARALGPSPALHWLPDGSLPAVPECFACHLAPARPARPARPAASMHLREAPTNQPPVRTPPSP